MSNELAKIEGLDGLQLDKYTEKDFDAAASSQSYLPRLQLMTANSSKCKGGEIGVNSYALVRDQDYKDLGKNVDVLLVTWRPKALETGEAVISVYDPQSADFQRIQAKSDEKDSGCMFGPEYLCWVPSKKTFATFFMGTKSARRESANVKALLKQAATLGSQHIKTPKYDWYAPKVQACSTPFEMPGKDELVEAVEKFNNPPVSEIEGVEETETRAR